MLSPRDVITDPVLGNVSIAYSNDTYIADRIFPVVQVGKQSGKYYLFDKTSLALSDSLRAAGSPSNEVEHAYSTDTYFAEDHALKEFVPDEVQDQTDPGIDVLSDATENVTERILVGKENELATMLTDTAQVTQNTTLSGTAQWSDYANSDPIGDVRTGRSTIQGQMFRKANTLLLGQQVFDVLVDHPDIVERVKYSALGVITEELLARVFQVEQVIVGGAGKNTGTEGAADALSYVWGKNAILLYVPTRAGMRQPAAGYTFTYGAPRVKRWRDEDREGTYVRVGGYYYDQKITAVGGIYLIKNAVA